MSYKLTIDGQEYRERNKDDLINMIIALWNERTGVGIRVEYPDGSFWNYEGF